MWGLFVNIRWWKEEGDELAFRHMISPWHRARSHRSSMQFRNLIRSFISVRRQGKRSIQKELLFAVLRYDLVTIRKLHLSNYISFRTRVHYFYPATVNCSYCLLLCLLRYTLGGVVPGSRRQGPEMSHRGQVSQTILHMSGVRQKIRRTFVQTENGFF